MRNQRPGEGSPHSVARTADRYRKQARFEDAIRLCLQELKARPAHASARVVLGRAYQERGDYVQAEEEFRRVLELSPENIRACVHLGQICEAQGRTEDAIRHYEAALELVPLNRDIRASLYRARRSLSSPVSSVSGVETKTVLEVPLDVSVSGPAETQGDLFATETLADLYALQGLDDRAGAIYRQLLDKEPFREGIREKLTTLEKRAGEVSFKPVAASGTPVASPREACQPQSLAVPLSPHDASEEPASAPAATRVRLSREQMLLEELESWLKGIRRYRNMAAASR